MPAIIVMALAISLIVTILDILNGLMNTDKEKIRMCETFNANKLQILTKIVIPANISTLFNTLKVNIGLSLVGVITGEFLVSKGGLGYLIVYGGQVFKLDFSNDKCNHSCYSCSFDVRKHNYFRKDNCKNKTIGRKINNEKNYYTNCMHSYNSCNCNNRYFG